MEYDLIEILIGLLALGVAAQWLAWRLRVPAIVLLTLTGFLVGPGLSLIEPSRDLGALFRPIIQIGVAVILFEGGLNLRLHELKGAGAGVWRLVILGAPLTLAGAGAAAHYLAALEWPVALVFGAIAVVTGPTVIMPLLRQARLKTRSASLLKWEGIVNDPIGALLAVVVFEYFVIRDQGGGAGEVLAHFVISLLGAALLGLAGGKAVAASFRRGYVPEFLKAPVMLAVVVILYALANAIQDEAGLLAVTVLGVVVGNARLPSMEQIRRIKEYITILLVSAVFILLTADLDPALLRELDWRDVAMIAVVLLVVRPVSVMVATAGAGLELRERALLAWIAPRGIVAAAVAGAFAPGLAGLGYAGAEVLVALVFALILVTVVLHGFTIGPLARLLGLAAEHRSGVLIVGASPWSIDLARALSELECPARLADASWHRLRPARLAGLSVYWGQVMSELAEQSLELHDVGYLIAATDNDAYNALVCTRFADEIGRDRIFQVSMGEAAEGEPRGYIPSLRGKVIFSESAVYEEMLRRYYQGWRFQKTRLSESFTWEDYRRTVGEEAMLAFVLDKGGTLRFAAADRELEPGAGDVVVTFMPERTSEQASDREAGDAPSPA